MVRLNCSLSPKFNDKIIHHLEVQKICTVLHFLQADDEKLMKITELSYKEITELKLIITQQLSGKIEDPAELFAEQTKCLSTGIASLDKLLNNGLRAGHIYELCGRSSSGKSQLCLCLAVNITLNTNTTVHYIATGTNFSFARIQMILAARNISSETINRILNAITVTRVDTIFQLLNVLYNFTNTLKETDTKLLIIDSLPGLLFMSPDNHEDFRILNNLADVCRYLSNEYSLSIITVNLIQQWRDNEGFGESTVTVKSSLGNYWSRIPNTRLLIEQTVDERRKITAWKSGHIKIGTCIEVTINNEVIV